MDAEQHRHSHMDSYGNQYRYAQSVSNSHMDTEFHRYCDGNGDLYRNRDMDAQPNAHFHRDGYRDLYRHLHADQYADIHEHSDQHTD